MPPTAGIFRFWSGLWRTIDVIFRQMSPPVNKNQKRKKVNQMKLKKLVPAALSLALVLSLAACGSPSEPSAPRPLTPILPLPVRLSPGTEAPAADDSLQKVLDAGKLTIAAEGNWVPYVYNEDGTGELTGFEVDIARRSAPAWAWSPTSDL